MQLSSFESHSPESSPLNLNPWILLRYLKAIYQHKWGILGLCCASAIVAVLLSLRLTPVFSANLTLQIENSRNNLIPGIYSFNNRNSEQYLLTQMSVVRSQILARTTVEDLGLHKMPEFKEKTGVVETFLTKWLPFDIFLSGYSYRNLGESDELAIRSAARILLGNLSIYNQERTQLLKLSFSSEDPHLAALIANEHIANYIEQNIIARDEESLKASSWLNERLSTLSEELKEAEAALRAFREQEGLIGDKGGFALANRELETVSANILNARDRRLELKNLLDQLNSLDQADVAQLDLIPAALKSEFLISSRTTLQELQRKKSELSKRYGYKHPTMINLKSELEEAQTLYRSQIQLVLESLQNEYQLALSGENSLKNSLKEAEDQLQGLNRKESTLRELTKNVESKQKLYDTFLTRFNESNATEGINTLSIRVTDPAVPPVRPSYPDRLSIVQITFLVTLLLCIAIVIVLEIMQNTVITPLDVEQKLRAVLLGIVPFIKPDKNTEHTYLYYLDNQRSNYAESIRTIRTSLVLSSLDESQKLIAITSTVPGEGKTSTSLSLALSFASMEKVLLIDADMRRPSIARVMNMSSARPGLSNVLAGTSTLADALYTLDRGNLKILSSGPIPPNPLELISSKRFATLLKELSLRFDRIIIDTAPCGAVSDAMALSKLVDSVIYVVKAGQTKANLAYRTIERLRAIDATLSGVVLNQVDTENRSGYGSNYYSGYYNYSGYGTEG